MGETLKLGDTVKDKMTGFTGVVTGRAEFLYTVPSVKVQPQGLKEDGSPKEAVWFEEPQLTLVTQV
jgi:hypothetical protein